MAFFEAFGLTATAGLSFVLVRRLREMAWAGVGFLALGVSDRARRAAPPDEPDARRLRRALGPCARLRGILSCRRLAAAILEEASVGSVRVAVVGVGNCASALVQGVHYYKGVADDGFIPGLMRPRLGGYHVGDIEFSAAFDIDANKVGLDLSEAIWAKPNNTVRFGEVPRLDVPVQRGMTHDGLGHYLSQIITKAPGTTADITQHPARDAHRRGGELPAGGQRDGDQVVRGAGARRGLRLRQLHPGVHRPRELLAAALRGPRAADRGRRREVAGRAPPSSTASSPSSSWTAGSASSGPAS